MPDNLPRRVRLTGGDYFICAIDRQMRRAGMPGNVCRLVVRLEGDLEIGRLRQRLAASPLCSWIARLRMVRWLPFLPPRWEATNTPPPQIAHLSATEQANAPGSPLPALLPERELRAGTSPALALDLVRGTGGGTHLVLSWHHALMDARGAELLLGHLADGTAPPLDPCAGPASPTLNGDHARRPWRDYLRRAGFARESLAFITTTCREPFFSLPPVARAAATCRSAYRVHWFDADETARIDGHCRRLDSWFRRSHFYLAAAVRALHAVAATRGNRDGAYIVPVPHDLRRRGAASPILSNQLSFLFFRIEAALAGSLPEVIRELTRQMLDQVRNRTPDSFLAAMEMFRPAPLDFYLRQLFRPAGGKFATFFFSDAGEASPGLKEVLGVRPTAVTHLAPVSRPPGLAVVFSRFSGRLCFVLSWVEDCLGAGEVDRLEQGICAALCEEDA